MQDATQNTQKPKETAHAFQITLLELVHIFLRRKFFIIAMCAATALFSAGYSMMLPSIYSATTKILPPKNEGGGLAALAGQMGALAGLAGGKGPGDSELYVGILNSRSLAEAVIERLALGKVYRARNHDELLQAFDHAVDVQTSKDGMICVTVQDLDPKRAALIANTCVDELGRASVRLNLTKAGAERFFLEKRLDITKKDLKNAEEDLKSFMERNNVVQPESQAGVALGSAAALKGQIASAELQLEVLRHSQTDDNPEVKSLLAAIARMKQDLARMVGKGNADGFPSMGSVPNLGLAYARKMREVQLQSAIFEQLTKQYEVAKLNDARDTSSVQVLDQAVVPEMRSKPKRTVIVLLSTLAAFVASLFLAVALEYHAKMPEEQRQVLSDLKKLAFSFR